MESLSLTSIALPAKPVEDLLHLLTTSGHLQFDHTLLPTPEATPELSVELSGPDTPLLTDRNGELLLAIEHIAAKILRLEPEEHDRISIDAGRFKADRDHELQLAADAAIAQVRATGRAFAFPSMTSRERRTLHLALQGSGLPTASSGLGPRRFVVLYPEGHEPVIPAAPPTHERAEAIRNRFRRR